ncbi:MAG: 6-phosphofructokinase [Bacillota bacterium]|nr:6-phosphofructokinase [Bacillota bacterium]
MRKIGILTSGGDTPGMNAAIRAAVKTALHLDMSVYGVLHGYNGLIEGQLIKLQREDVADIIHKGGTILKTARSESFKTEEGFEKALSTIKASGLEGLIVIGGDGSMRGARALSEHKVPTIGLPGTIDNDLSYTDYSIGFYTAVNSVIQELYKIMDTMDSLDRIGVVEVMGNKSGCIALYSGLAGASDYIILPEMPFDIDEICKGLCAERIKGKTSCVIVVSEASGDCDKIAEYITQKTGFDARGIELGHIQRGGDPTAFDRILASRMGAHAVKLLSQGIGNRVIGIRNDKIVDYDITEALGMQRTFDKELYDLALMLTE